MAASRRTAIDERFKTLIMRRRSEAGSWNITSGMSSLSALHNPADGLQKPWHSHALLLISDQLSPHPFILPSVGLIYQSI